MRVFAIEFEISLSLWKSAQTIVHRFFRNDLAHQTKINDIHKCHLHEKRKFQFHVRTVAHTHTHTHNVYYASQLCTQGNAFAIYFSIYKIKINRDKQPLICWYWAFGQIRPNTWYGHKNIPIPFHARTHACTHWLTHCAQRPQVETFCRRHTYLIQWIYIVAEFRRHFVTDWQSVPLFVTHIRKMYFDTLRNNQNWGTTVIPNSFLFT